MSKLIVAVDGPSGAGKSTVSKMLAERLEIVYIDTGAMYRAVALKSVEAGVAAHDCRRLGALARASKIKFKMIEGVNHTFLDGEDVTETIRSPEISMLTSKVSAVPQVREALVEKQRELGRKFDVIMDGRDIGSVVFPDAQFKFYLDADLEVRGKRRYLELKDNASFDKDIDSTVKDLAERDKADAGRKESPLKYSADAVYIDTTRLDPLQVVEKMENLIRSKKL